MATLVFLHGLETGPHGWKYQALRDQVDAGLLAPDCEGVMDVDARLRIVEQALAGNDDLVLVGSSFGGLIAVLFADRHPQRVHGYVLCAPALHVLRNPVQVPPVVRILHAVEDAVVPISASRAFAAQHQVPLIEVHDDHRLSGSMAKLVELTREVLAAAH